MKKMKQKIGLICVYGIITSATYSQTPTGTPPANNTNAQAKAAWYRGGNNLVGNANNIFGTAAGFNSPIFHQTNGINRMQMNGTVSNVINGGASLPKDGFIGIGSPTGFYNGNAGGQGPFSLLHLNGINAGVSPQTSGYRDWMRFGITSTHNQDLAFFGQRSNNNQSDNTDVVVGWGDNTNRLKYFHLT